MWRFSMRSFDRMNSDLRRPEKTELEMPLLEMLGKEEEYPGQLRQMNDLSYVPFY